jgi:molecular chaperone GrpE (heat shock protein)
MYLPALARDLYKSQKEVESLEHQLQGAENVQKQEQIKDQLRQAKAELEQIRKVMEGRKEHSRASLNKPKSLF